MAAPKNNYNNMKLLNLYIFGQTILTITATELVQFV
jgi:hypothetical protein